MKKIFTFTLLVLMTFGVVAQTVPTKKMAFMAKKTATWCGPCGDWGWDLFEEIYNYSNNEKYVTIELHDSQSSKLYSADGRELYGYMETIGSTPAFYIGMGNETAYSPTGGIYTTTTKTNVTAAADSILNVDADISTGFDAYLEQNQIVVNTKTKAFKALNGDYKLGVYVIEKDVVEYQASRGNDAVHKTVLREAISDNVMGDDLHNGALTAGQEITKKFMYTIDPSYNKDKLQVFVLLFRLDNGTDYVLENSYTNFDLVKEITVSVPYYESNEIEVEAYKSVDVLNYYLKIGNSANVKVELINLQGQIQESLYNGTIGNELSEKFNVSNIPQGVYILNTTVDGVSYTDKLKL